MPNFVKKRKYILTVVHKLVGKYEIKEYGFSCMGFLEGQQIKF